jgi:hypothetical protein
LLKAFLTPLMVTADNILATYNGSTSSNALTKPVYSINGADTSGHLHGTATPYANDRNVGTYAADLWSDQRDGYDISVVNGNLTINKAALTLTTDNVIKTYDGTITAAGNATASGGTHLFGTDSLSGGTFAYTDRNAGTGNKTVTTTGVTVIDGNGGNNYAIAYVNNTTSAINPAMLTVTGATAANKTYDGSLDATVGGGVLNGVFRGDSVGLLQTGLFSDRNAGANKTVTENFGLSGSDSGNYVLANGTAQSTASITPDNLTITANNQGKVAGTPNPVLTLTYSGFVAGESASSLTTRPAASTTADTSSPSGNYAITVSGAVDPNYTFTYMPGTLTVTSNLPHGYLGALASENDFAVGDMLASRLSAATIADSTESDPDSGGPYLDTDTRSTDSQSVLSLRILDRGIRLPKGVP